ncbi:hypothetical protein D9M68_433750 [compost metagenome]
MTAGFSTTSLGAPLTSTAPSFSTMMRSDSAMVACIMCSMSSTDTPESRIRRIIWMDFSMSVGFRPAITSSSSRMRGLIASARATSRRFIPPTVRLRASVFRYFTRSVCSATLSAICSASSRSEVRMKAPSMMFSSTVRPVNGLAIWNVRPRPWCANSSGVLQVTQLPWASSIEMPPLSGERKPDSRLNTVVLPAPFGPIMPRISFWFSVSDTSLVARRPPKLLNSLSAFSTGFSARTALCRRTSSASLRLARGVPR